MLALMLYLAFLDGKKTRKFLFSLLCSLYFGFKFNLFFDLKKCPECYGDEFCQFFQNGQIQFTWFGYLLSVVNPNLTKSVYHGIFNGTQIVVKRKAQRIDLSDDKIENVVLCPGVEGDRFLYTNQNGKLWLDLGMSMEPLLLKYFESEPGWPFPKYLGACGDLIIEEDKGQPLSGFIESDFKTRAGLAVELLKMSQLFTFGHPNYAFYFTDYSIDNLVADSRLKVFLVDLDNVIISAKSRDAYSIKDSIHKSRVWDDKNYAFCPSDICNHYLSDHNFFSVCKYLLSHPQNGLLKVIPADIKDQEKLSYLLGECTDPETTEDRFSAGRQLQSLLEQITKGS